MAVPPKGDPQRPLHLAIRSSLVMAILSLLLGISLYAYAASNGGYIDPVFVVILFVVFFAPSATYFLIFVLLKNRLFGVTVLGILVASIQLFLSLCLAAFLILVQVTGNRGAPIPISSAAFLVPMSAVSLVFFASAHLIYRLTRAGKIIKVIPIDAGRGFEPVMIERIDPSSESNEPSPPSQ
jgi:hypothetical protein